MAESEQDRIFRTKVIPIMNKVRNELQDKMADELKEHTSSFAGLMASAIGPDGGMSARQAQMHSYVTLVNGTRKRLKIILKWSRKNFNASTSSLILLWRKR